MARTLQTSQSTAISATIGVAPGYLVEILFPSPIGPARYSSMGAISWSGNSWADENVMVTSVATDITQSTQSANIVISNATEVIGADLITNGIANVAINIWTVYGRTPAANEPVQIFSGVGDSFSLDTKSNKATISAIQINYKRLYTPRKTITAENGFSILPAVGKKISFNGQIYVMETTN